MEHGNKAYVNQINVKLQSSKHNLKDRCVQQFTDLVLLNYIKSNNFMIGTLQCNQRSLLPAGVKQQGQAEVGAVFRAAVRTRWPGVVKQLESTEAVESRQEQMGPRMRGINRQGSPSSKIPISPNSHFRRGY